MDAARSSLTTGTVVRGDVYPNLASRFDFWPVKSAEGQNAVIGLAFDPDERLPSPDTLVNIVVSVLTLVLDRQHAGSNAMPDRQIKSEPSRAPSLQQNERQAI